MSAGAGAREIDLLLFEVGGNLFGAEASEVKRIERPDGSVDASPLGDSIGAGRALVFDASGEEGRIRVDLVRGVRSVSMADLRRLPPASAPKAYVIGVWLDGETPVLLIDLVEMLKTQKRR